MINSALALHRHTTNRCARPGSTWVEGDLQHRAVAANVRKVAGVVVLEGLGGVAKALGAANGRDSVRIEQAGQVGALLRRHLRGTSGG